MVQYYADDSFVLHIELEDLSNYYVQVFYINIHRIIDTFKDKKETSKKHKKCKHFLTQAWFEPVMQYHIALKRMTCKPYLKRLSI